MEDKKPPTTAKTLQNLEKDLIFGPPGTCPEAPDGWEFVGKVEDSTGCWCTYTHIGPPAGTLRIACD